MDATAAVEVLDVTKEYGTRRALERVSLRVETGARTVVLGHNGAGKSTLLEIIATLRVPTRGTVSVGGHDTVQDVRNARRLIGLTPQSNALDPLATTSEVLRFQGAALGMARRTTSRRADELLGLFGLGEHRGTRVMKLSGGTRRKLDLAVALMAEPPVVILDEPTTGLDPLARLDFWGELKRLNEAGTTLIVSTQDLHEADVLATDIIVLRDGRVAVQGSPSVLKQQVGERTLTLVLSSDEALESLLTASHAPFRSHAESARTVQLAVPNTADALVAALGDISRIGNSIEQLSLGEPSLDDVFVAMAVR